MMNPLLSVIHVTALFDGIGAGSSGFPVGLMLLVPLIHWIMRHHTSPATEPDTTLVGKGARLYRDPEELAVAFDSLSEYVDHHASLNRIERAILEDTSLEDTVEVALAQLVDMIPCDRASVLEYDAIMNEGYLVGECGFNLVESDAVPSLEEIWNDGVPSGDWYQADLKAISNPTPIEKTLLLKGFQSCYCHTLVVGDRAVGSLNVASLEKDGFNQDRRWVVRDIADLLSIAFRQHLHLIDRAWYETELIIARDRAQELARMKSAFLTVMTHELRTPLSGILGCTQILEEEGTDLQKEFTGLIGDAAKRLLSTINSVLDLSRLEAQKDSLKLTRVDAVGAARDCVRLLRPMAESKGVNLVLDTEEEVWAMLDEGAIHRILNNLIGNAVKFTDAGSVTVRAGMENDRVRLEIEDTGVGIDTEFLPHIFEEFRQEYMGSNRPHEGSGLGLAITKRLIQKMNGRIHVDSIKDKGTTIRVVFPVVDSRDGEDTNRRNAHVSLTTGFRSVA